MIRVLLIVITTFTNFGFAETNIAEGTAAIGKLLAMPGQRFGSDLADMMAKQRNIEVTPINVRFKGHDITFQHQLWKIKDQSVCSNYPSNTPAKSNCDVAAKELFILTCSNLAKKANKSALENRSQNMYCNAAIDFKPKIIQISAAKEKTGLEQARRECNLLIVQDMGNSSPKISAQKKEACENYEKMKIQ